MNGWQGEYTGREWIQMAACLLGTPLMALLTAWFTKHLYPQRNLVRCTLGGLAVAAIVALAFFVPFVLWVLVFRGSGSAKFLQLFDSLFGFGLTVTAIVGAAVGARVAAHTQRARESQRQPGGTVSLRQLFLLQLLPFVVLGCWLGMRSAALNVSPGLERAQRKWSARGWEVHTDEKENLLGLARDRPYLGMDQAEENVHLREASREKWVKELRFGVASDPAAFDFACFSKHPSLRNLYLTYAYGSLVSTKHLKELASIPSLESLQLKSAGSNSDSLAPLALAPKLQRLSIETMTIDPKDFNGLQACKSLKVLSVTDLTPTNLAPIEFPESLEELTLQTRFLWTFSDENFRAMKHLRQFTMHVGGISREELAAIAAAPNLEALSLGRVSDPADLQLLLSTPRLTSLEFGCEAEGADKETLLIAALERLALHPTLTQLRCDSSFFILPLGGGDISPPPPPPPTTKSGTLVMFGAFGGGVGQWIDQLKVKELQTRMATIRAERGLPALEVQLQPGGPNGFGVPEVPRAAYKRPHMQGGRP